METNFTLKSFRYLALTIGLAYLSLNLNGQTSTKVTVVNYSFSPKNITITAGDTVIWKNNNGTHNVDGKQSVFSSNPESFGNSLGSGWTYKFVFNTAGTYNYQCDPHAAMGMVGQVVVNPKTVTANQSLSDNSGNIVLYPNPASDFIELKVPASYSEIQSLKVYSITGSLIDQKISNGNALDLRYDISPFKKGIYFMEINTASHKDVLKFMKR